MDHGIYRHIHTCMEWNVVESVSFPKLLLLLELLFFFFVFFRLIWFDLFYSSVNNSSALIFALWLQVVLNSAQRIYYPCTLTSLSLFSHTHSVMIMIIIISTIIVEVEYITDEVTQKKYIYISQNRKEWLTDWELYSFEKMIVTLGKRPLSGESWVIRSEDFLPSFLPILLILTLVKCFILSLLWLTKQTVNALSMSFRIRVKTEESRGTNRMMKSIKNKN